MIDISNAKWDFSKEERYAILWMREAIGSLQGVKNGSATATVAAECVRSDTLRGLLPSLPSANPPPSRREAWKSTIPQAVSVQKY